MGGAVEGQDEEAEAFEAGQREVAPFNAGQLRLGVLQVQFQEMIERQLSKKLQLLG